MELTKETKQNYTGVGIYRHNRNYIGDYVDGKEHGIGMYETRISYDTKQDIYEPLHRYVGQFDNNKAEGIGIKSYYEGKEIYCGEYKNDKRNGIGYWKYPSGAIFVGEHKNHRPDGFGILITYEELKFIGYVEGWAARKGKWYDQNDNEIDIREFGYDENGNKYVGEFKDGKEWNGTGYKNGEIVVRFVNGKQQ